MDQETQYAIGRVEHFTKTWRFQRANQQIATVEDGHDTCAGLNVSDLEAFIAHRDAALAAMRQVRPSLAFFNLDTTPIDAVLPDIETPATDDESRLKVFDAALNALIAEARAAGVVLTVETKSLEPLAMRNYEMVGSVRLAR
jgi:hypothetical protein